MVVGHVAQLWRYPVKSMQGQQCDVLTVGPFGIDGDRRLAFESDDAPIGKPLLRSTDRTAMLRARAQLNTRNQATVQIPDGFTMSVTDDALLLGLSLTPSARSLRLLESDRPFTDVRPIALHSLATEHAFATALGSFDGRRLRSNIILRLVDERPFAEDNLAGATIQIGDAAQINLLERIPRCRMVSLHPESAAPDPAILRWLSKTHDGRAGIYARTHQLGSIFVGDPVRLIQQTKSC